MARSIALLACLIATLAAASTVSGKLLYPARNVAAGWSLIHAEDEAAKVERSQTLTIAIGLKRKNVDKMNEFFWAVSDPTKAETYGRHVTDHDEMRKLVGASPEQIKSVKDWLLGSGMCPKRFDKTFHVSAHHDWAEVELSLAEIEKLLGVTFQNYVHTSGKILARALQAVHIPDHLSSIVQTISGYGGFPAENKYDANGKLIGARPVEKIIKKMGSPQTNVTPQLLFQVYNETFTTTPAGKRNIMSFFQAQGQWVNQSDLTTFCETFFNRNCSIAKYIGNNQNAAGIESSLDSEYIMSTGHFAETWVYTYNNFDFCGDLMRWAKDVFIGAAEGAHPMVISMSYGSQALPNYCLGPDIARLSEDIQKMGLMGISVVIASGDDGSGESNRQTGFNYGFLAPSEPASIPYATAVGSTTFVAGNSGQQMASSAFGSGGGFSSNYGQLSFQQPAVAHYFKTANQLPSWISYNGSGRATPDVSALGEGYNIISSGAWMQVDGTSCSTPVFAGMVSQLNNIRLAANKTLGFLGPLIYGKAVGGFTDIVAGTNDVVGDGQGWEAVPGYDPSTGLGTPNFGALANIIKSLNERDSKVQAKYQGLSVLHGTPFGSQKKH